LLDLSQQAKYIGLWHMKEANQQRNDVFLQSLVTILERVEIRDQIRDLLE
jgi:hypothetical protein